MAKAAVKGLNLCLLQWAVFRLPVVHLNKEHVRGFKLAAVLVLGHQFLFCVPDRVLIICIAEPVLVWVCIVLLDPLVQTGQENGMVNSLLCDHLHIFGYVSVLVGKA